MITAIIFSAKTLIMSRKKKFAMNHYIDLKRKRDIECIKIKEASNILKYLNSSCLHGYWCERLLAEKTLLESGCAIDLIRKKISEDYINLTEKQIQIGSITISNFKFYENNNSILKHNETEFYVLLLSNETEIKSSKIARATNKEIVFNEEFVFSANKNTAIKVEIYSVIMKEPSKFSTLNKLLTCKKSAINNFFKIQFKNLNTCEYEEVQTLKTSFVLCGGTEVDIHTIHNKTWKLNLTENSSVTKNAVFSVATSKFKIENNRHSGFLTLGRTLEETLFWNRFWCVLDNNLLNIYKYPSEEDTAYPQLTLELVKCYKVEQASEALCNRPRSFILEILEDSTPVRYYFMADNHTDLQIWLKAVNSTLDLLRLEDVFKS